VSSSYASPFISQKEKQKKNFKAEMEKSKSDLKKKKGDTWKVTLNDLKWLFTYFVVREEVQGHTLRQSRKHSYYNTV